MTIAANKTMKHRVVSFLPYVTVRKYIPISDPRAKQQLYYSSRDLKKIKKKADLMVLKYKLQSLESTREKKSLDNEVAKDFKFALSDYISLK